MIKKRGFSITELLVSIAIIGILTALIVPGVDRAMNKNHLPNDIKVMQAKFEETRTMSASRGADQGGINYDEISSKTKKVGYYGVYFPSDTSLNEYYIVKLSRYKGRFVESTDVTDDTDPAYGNTTDYCWVDDVVAKKSECILETIKFSKDVVYTYSPARIYAYLIPEGTYYIINEEGNMIMAGSKVSLKQGKRAADASIGINSAMINVTYSTLP